MTTIGIVGPADLVTSSARVCARLTSVSVATLPYRRETDVERVISDASADIDGWLFTGVVPYEIASAAGILDRPATFVEYTGATLLRSLVKLLREGKDVTSMSIDTLDRQRVHETLKEADLPISGIRVLPYAPGQGTADLVEFHRAAASQHSAQVAITCLRSAYDQLRDDLAAVRLAPSIHSVRTAANGLLLGLSSQQSGDAQIALGLIEIKGNSLAVLEQEVSGLGATLIRLDEHTHLVVTTRGPLERLTASFTDLPMLTRLQTHYGDVQIGFGVGGSGAEAEALARRALGRARSGRGPTAVVSLRNDIDFTLASAAPSRRTPRVPLELLSQRTGLSKQTLKRFSALTGEHENLTTRVVATSLGVQLRTARRMLNRLERAGVATSIGTQNLEGSGRPLVVYRLNL